MQRGIPEVSRAVSSPPQSRVIMSRSASYGWAGQMIRHCFGLLSLVILERCQLIDTFCCSFGNLFLFGDEIPKFICRSKGWNSTVFLAPP